MYVHQPQGYEVKGEDMKVYWLIKALYGLKQAPKAWYKSIDGHFRKKMVSENQQVSPLCMLKQRS